MTCVLIWLYVVCITTIFFMFYTLVYACIPDTMIYDVISIGEKTGNPFTIRISDQHAPNTAYL